MPCSQCGDIIPLEAARCPACGGWARRRDFRAIGGAVFTLLGFNAFLSLGNALSLVRIMGPLANATNDSYDPRLTDQALSPYADVLLVTTVLAGLTGIAFVAWLWRAYRYAEEDWPQRHGRGWVIAGWFCPLANLWIPPRLVHDVWVGSGPRTAAERHRSGVIVAAWWITLLSAIAMEQAFRSVGVDSLAQARFVVNLGLAGAAAQALAGTLCMMIVYQVTRLQAAASHTGGKAS